MAQIDQPLISYSDTAGDVRVISDVIHMIDPRDTPLLDALGGPGGANSKFRAEARGTKIELIEDELAPLTGAVSNGTVAITTDTLTFSVADGSVFQPGHVIKIDSELLVIKTVSTDSLTVHARNYGGTNATHATDAAISIVGMARLEGADASYDGIVPLAYPYNYTSIFQAGLAISGTNMVVSKYGKGNEWDYQASKRIPELLIKLERGAFHQARQVGSATSPRSMGGLGTFITTNTVSAGGAIEKKDVEDAMEKAFGYGGNPDLLVLNPAVARDLHDLIDTKDFIRTDLANTKIGMAPLQVFVTQFGTLRMVIDRHCPVGDAWVLDSRKAGFWELRPFGWHELARTGDAKKGEVIGEYSFLLSNEKAHCRIYGITS